MAAHVKIVFGTDIGGIPWTEPIAQEFPRMVGFGMSPMDAIKSATSRAAEMLDMKGELGSLAPGAYADVITVGDQVEIVEYDQDGRVIARTYGTTSSRQASEEEV